MIDYFHTKAPGVYIEEISPTGPIVGVSTSTVAFIGPAMSGPIGKPIRITNWTQFTQNFGRYPAAPKTLFYTPYAVSGFFNNSGTAAYMVRVGTAKNALLNLNDRATTEKATTTLVVTAKQEGTVGNSIQVTVQDSQIVNSTPIPKATVEKARAPITSAENNIVALKDAVDVSQFSVGDIITIENSTERAQIERILGNQLVLVSNLANKHEAPAFVRIADLIANQKIFRIQNSDGIEVGSVINLAKGDVQESHVVDSLANNFVTLATGLTNTFQLAEVSPSVVVTTLEFTLIVSRLSGQPPVTETFSNLSMDPRHSHYFERTVNSTLVTVAQPLVPNVQPPPNNRPMITAMNLAHGEDDNLSSIGVTEYQDALTALTALNDVSILCVPDASTSNDIQQAVVDHCDNMHDRFAILDISPDLSDINRVTAQRNALRSNGGYAAIYYPWILVNDPNRVTGSATLLIPPSGHIAGIYARSDSQRGVHKAPANEVIAGARDLEFIKGTGDYDLLNQSDVNVLRSFAGQPPVVWGARTIAKQVAWQYINVRRLFIFIEQSLLLSLRWVVFEPNDTALWKKLERTISEFLSRIWRGGALFGNKASEAFYVKINEELNPPATRNMGQVFIEIGVAPVFPAEFVIVRIAMWDGGSQTSEG